MSNETIEIKTSLGPMKTAIYKPDGKGPWPAVIVFMDAFGYRESILEIGERLAKSGFLAAVPDLYHNLGHPLDLLPEDQRSGEGAAFKIFGDDKLRGKFFGTFYAPATDYKNIEANVGPLLDYLEKSSDVNGKIGTTGYCMGGNISFRTATVFGDRVKATASFHGGFLASDQPDSPHKRSDKVKSNVYVGGAIEDDSFSEKAKEQLDEALTAAHVKHEIVWYQAKHGFAVRDNPSFDPKAAEQHYEAMNKVFGALSA